MSSSFSGDSGNRRGLTAACLEGKGLRKNVGWRASGVRCVLEDSRMLTWFSQHRWRSPARRGQKSHCALTSRLCVAGGVEQDVGPFHAKKLHRLLFVTQGRRRSSSPSPPDFDPTEMCYHASLSNPFEINFCFQNYNRNVPPRCFPNGSRGPRGYQKGAAAQTKAC